MAGSRQKTEGNHDDVVRVVRNLKNGMVWEQAKHHESFMMVEDAWYEKNKALLLQYVETGIPVPPDNITNIIQKPAPVDTVATPDGKIWAIYRDRHGNLTREEVKLSAPVVEEVKTMKAEAKPKQEKW